MNPAGFSLDCEVSFEALGWSFVDFFVVTRKVLAYVQKTSTSTVIVG